MRRVKRYCIRYYDGYQEELERSDLMQDTVVLVQDEDSSDNESSKEESLKLLQVLNPYPNENAVEAVAVRVIPQKRNF